MKTGLFSALAATLALSGCSTTSVLQPPEAALRDQLGRVAVVALTNAPHILLQVPDSRADVAAEEQSFETVTPRMVATKMGPGSGGPEGYLIAAVAFAAPLLVMGGSPVAQEVRRAYGMIVADSADAVTTARRTLDTLVAQVRFEDQLRIRLADELGRHASAVPIAPSRGEANTVLEIMVYEPNLSGAESINPGLRLSLGLRVRLLDARTGRQLYYDYLDYRGPRHSFVTWAADDARLFRAEIHRCLAHLSTEIVAQLFTRAPDEVAARSELAALGIERRPPGNTLSSPGPVWAPNRNLGGLARR
jgi:hypothetical protein